MDWNSAAENGISGVLGMVPEVGSILSTLVNIFWPSGEDVWSQIEQQVEQLIDQKIDQLVYEDVQNSLQGLKNNIGDYLAAVKAKDMQASSETWIATNGDFDQQLPSFQAQGYELLLLPLFGQFVNLHLSLLRDGVLCGSSKWGWNADYQRTIATKLTTTIAAYTQYANNIYAQGYQNVVNNTGADNHNAQPFRSVNTYVRQMTLTVLDFVQMWPYFDATTYPQPVKIYLNREIYSDPVGTCDDSGAINLPGAPTQPISQISVWGWDRIDAVQVTFPEGGGANGITQTRRMGDQGGGSNAAPHGGVFNVTSNPVTFVGGLSGDILNALSFQFKDGSGSGTMGGNYPGGSGFGFSYDGEILSRIHINGVSNFYGSADCAVFGFKYDPNRSRTTGAGTRPA